MRPDALHPPRETPLVIHGAGGHGRVAAGIAELRGFRVLGFVSDDAHEGEPTVRVGIDDFEAVVAVHVAVGNNADRRRLTEGHRSTHPHVSLATLVHPTASIAADGEIASGCFIGPLAVVGGGVRVGEGCIVNSGAIVEHDCRLGAFSHVAPGSVLGGGVRVGGGVLLGLGCRVLPGLTVGERAVVGAGSVVLRDVVDGETVVGVVR